jgi:hypothetical protein
MFADLVLRVLKDASCLAADVDVAGAGRATPADLNDTGRKQLGLQPW